MNTIKKTTLFRYANLIYTSSFSVHWPSASWAQRPSLRGTSIFSGLGPGAPLTDGAWGICGTSLSAIVSPKGLAGYLRGTADWVRFGVYTCFTAIRRLFPPYGSGSPSCRWENIVRLLLSIQSWVIKGNTYSLSYVQSILLAFSMNNCCVIQQLRE